MPRWAKKEAPGESQAEQATEAKTLYKETEPRKGTISEALAELRDHKRRIEEAIESLEKL